MKYLLFFGCLAALSCQTKPKLQPHNRKFADIPVEIADAKSLSSGNAKPVVYNIPDSAIDYDLDSLIDSIDYVQLETKSECQIGSTDAILFLSDLIIVVDKFVSETVFVFDRRGKFLYKLTSSNVNSNSFSRILDVSIDQDAGLIMVLDDKSSAIYHYDSSGKLVDKTRFGLRFKEFVNLSKDRKLVFTASMQNDHLPEIENFTLLILQNEKTVEFKDFYKDPILQDIPYFGRFHISSIDSNCYFFPRFSDTVFKILPTGYAIPVYKLRLGRPMPKEFLFDDLNRKMFYRKVVEDRYDYFMGDFQENQSHIFTILHYNHGSNATASVIVNKESGNALNISSFRYNSRGIEYPGFASPVAVQDDRFISVINNTLLKQLKQRAKEGKFKLAFASEKMKSLFDDIQPNSNPMVLSYTLKRF